MAQTQKYCQGIDKEEARYLNQGKVGKQESLLETRIMFKWECLSDVNVVQNLCPTILLREGSLKTPIWTKYPYPSPPPTGCATLNRFVLEFGQIIFVTS